MTYFCVLSTNDCANQRKETSPLNRWLRFDFTLESGNP